MSEQETPPVPTRLRTWPTWPRPGVPVAMSEWQNPQKPAKPGGGSGRSLVRSAGIVAIAFVLSRILGLVREIILSRMFGTSPEYSAYVSAFRVPDLLFLIIMAGSFGSAFIPVFSGLIGKGERDDASKLASTVLNLSAIALAVTGALAFVFAGPIVTGIVARGADPAVQEITINCMRILLLSPVFLGLGIAAKGILEGQDQFTLPAFAPVVYNIATILGAIFLGPRFGVYGVAIGVVIGAICHIAIQIPGLVSSGLHWRPAIDLSTPGLKEVGRLLGPRVIGQAAFQINFIAVTSLAWRSGEQSVSALNYAWQLLMLPHGVLALSISTVVFPTMARLWESGDRDGMRAAFGRALKPLLFLSAPAAIILFFFRTSIVQTLFQGGAFTGESTRLVTAPLAWFAAGLIAYAAVEVLTRAFYAMHDTATPVAAGIFIIVLNIALGAALVDRYGYVELAFALSLTTAIEMIILLVVLKGRIGGIGPDEVVWLGKVLLASIVMAGACLLLAPFSDRLTTPGDLNRLLQAILVLLIIGLAGAIYMAAAWALKIPELRIAARQVLSRLPGGGRIVARI
jgi:putative peptidoglycan lipid II flippase